MEITPDKIEVLEIIEKNKDKNKTDKLDDLYQNAKGKLSKMYKLLMANAAFMMFLQSFPILMTGIPLLFSWEK